MSAKEELFKRLFTDKPLNSLIKQIKETCNSFGEDNDDVLDYLIGATVVFYNDPKNALVNFNVLTYSVLKLLTENTLEFATNLQDKDESRVPIA